MFKSAKNEIHRLFSEIENRFSPDSEDYSSPIVIKLFQRGLKIYYDSNGCFDVTVSPLTIAWGFFNTSYRVPKPQEIKALLKTVGMEKIKIQEGKLSLSPGMKLDWGGIAKGYGIDLASQSLIALGIQKGFVNAGGDLFCWGENPENQPWKIGIKHPRKSGFLGVISISNLGAATTGDYQRFFILNGERHHHVFDPRTGFPAKGKQSVTVVGPETLVCDALSTALFVSKYPDSILQKYPEYGAFIVNSEGKTSRIGKGFVFQPIEQN